MQPKITTCSPYTADLTLMRNIANWMVALPDVNIDAFQEVRNNNMIRNIKGKSTFANKLKQKGRAKTLGNGSAVKVAKYRAIDYALLFERFFEVSTSEDLSLEDVLPCELSPILLPSLKPRIY
ncbi:hypothetical protein DPMN_159034 [Dreissena polymorpha]|uniref:Uncharacterized protein n=1 Tax=Dreissena polymorpha TaxID=45954 RepID=A0A9D4EK97_DREPO|nr:hypothetical protein DPMN_159034 [Dreissena polymorpha]